MTDIKAGSVIVTSSILVPAHTTPAEINAIVGELKSGTVLSQPFMQKYGVAAVVGALVSVPTPPASPVNEKDAGTSNTIVTIAAAVGAAGGSALVAAIVAFLLIRR